MERLNTSGFTGNNLHCGSRCSGTGRCESRIEDEGTGGINQMLTLLRGAQYYSPLTPQSLGKRAGDDKICRRLASCPQCGKCASTIGSQHSEPVCEIGNEQCTCHVSGVVNSGNVEHTPIGGVHHIADDDCGSHLMKGSSQFLRVRHVTDNAGSCGEATGVDKAGMVAGVADEGGARRNERGYGCQISKVSRGKEESSGEPEEGGDFCFTAMV